MKCSIQGCPGEYEGKEILHTVHRKEEIFVFEGVPAEVCSVCGDTLLAPETVQHIQELLETKAKPERLIPLYAYT